MRSLEKQLNKDFLIEESCDAVSFAEVLADIELEIMTRGVVF